MELKRIMLRFEDESGSYLLMTPAGTVQTDAVRMTAEQSANRVHIRIFAEREIKLKTLNANFKYPFSEDDRIFLNGYQSWTDSTEHTVHDKMRGIDHIPKPVTEKYAFSQYGDYNFTSYPNSKGFLHGWSYGYVRRGDHYFLFASLNEQDGFTCIRTQTEDDMLEFCRDCEGLHFTGGYSMELFFAEGTEREVFDAYFDALGIAPKAAAPLLGYTSWYRHYQNISAGKLLDDLHGLQALPQKADVFQIDDGWQTAVGDWVTVQHSKFPKGLQPIVQEIHAAGYCAGIWLAPFVCERDSEIYRQHRDWLVHNADVKPVCGGSNWSGFYALDIYNAEVRAYLRNVFRVIVQEWGFRLLKLDFLYAVCLEPRHDKTRGQIMFEALDFLREIAGDAQILGCGVPLAAAFGKVDYCRIGCDVSLDWDDKPYMRLMHRERVSTKRSILNSVFRRQLNGRAFGNDPDVFLLRQNDTAMSEAQKRTLAEINALTGSVLFTSDDGALYTQEQKKILNRMMKLRDAEILQAEMHGDLLEITFRYGEKTYTRRYRI